MDRTSDRRSEEMKMSGFQSSNEEFFKLSAAASEELSNKVPDSREQEFHDFVREIIVCDH